MERGKDLDPTGLVRATFPEHCEVEAGPGMFKRPIGKVSEDAAVREQKFVSPRTSAGNAKSLFLP